VAVPAEAGPALVDARRALAEAAQAPAAFRQAGPAEQRTTAAVLVERAPAALVRVAQARVALPRTHLHQVVLLRTAALMRRALALRSAVAAARSLGQPKARATRWCPTARSPFAPLRRISSVEMRAREPTAEVAAVPFRHAALTSGAPTKLSATSW
jgi:hypothetical protein